LIDFLGGVFQLVIGLGGCHAVSQIGSLVPMLPPPRLPPNRVRSTERTLADGDLDANRKDGVVHTDAAGVLIRSKCGSDHPN
jgi:hypothetical protein